MAKPDLIAYLNSINKTKENLMRDDPDGDPQAVSGYPAFLVRKLMSYHPDAVLFVNELNMLHHLDNQLQYEYMLSALPKKNRYAKTHKVQNSDTLELVKQYYNYSDIKALEVMSLHTEKDFERMRDHFSEGGIRRDKQSSK